MDSPRAILRWIPIVSKALGASREIRVAPPELERWRREFLEGGQQGLKKKNRPGGELMRTRAKLGEMTMRVELQAELLEKRGYGDELRKLLRRLDG